MNNNDLLPLVPTLVTALAGLLTAIAGIIPTISTVQKTRNKAAISASTESASSEFLKMKRMPLEQTDWQSFKIICLLSAVISAFFITLIVVGVIVVILRFIFIPGSFSTAPLRIILGLLSLMILIINLVIYTRLFLASASFYIAAGKDPEDARNYLFQETKIEAQIGYKDVFSRCRVALQDISMQNMEYDFSTGVLEADVNIGFRFFRGILRVKIDQLEDNRCLIQIKLTPSFFKVIPSVISNSSWMVNQFIKRVSSP